MKTPNPDLRNLLAFAVRNHLRSIEVEDLRGGVVSSRRATDTRPGDFRVAAHEDLLKALRGPVEKSPVDVFLVVVPREVSKRMGSRIVLPGDV